MDTPIDTVRALQRVHPQWDSARTERLLTATHRRLERRRVARGALVASALVLGIGGLALALLAPQRAAPSAAAPAPSASIAPTERAAARVVRFLDGSVVQLGAPDSSLKVQEVSKERVALELEQGDGHFHVTSRPERSFVVRAGNVTIEVVGTEFDVAIRGARTRLAVSQGVVRVDWAHASANLGAGAQGWFPPDDQARPVESSPPSGGYRPTEAATPASARRGADPRQSYREQIDRNDYSAAFSTMDRDPAVVGTSVPELMLAADVARLGGHPARAIPYLQRVVDRHPSHPQAPLAAFTLGRIFVGMGQNERAEKLFAKAGGLAPDGQLAEDALARQVRSAVRAGDRAEAQRLGREYLLRFPQGRRTEEVRKAAGL